ncbi:MAG: hypothetical protein VW644_08035 [Alphaproteobacteria bacterium]|jgi:hypothetical protein
MLNTNDTPAGSAAPRDRSAPSPNPTDELAGGPDDAPPRRFTEIGAKRFLDELAETGSVCEAARRARMPRASLYRRRADDPAFARSWDEALEMAYDLLHDEAMRRAIEGVDKPVFYRGEEVATVRQKSDRLLMFLMRAHRPERYDPSFVRPHEPGPEEIAEREAARERAKAMLDALRAERETAIHDAIAEAVASAARNTARRKKAKRGGKAGQNRAGGAATAKDAARKNGTGKAPPT